jgi:transposase InsO family protein
VRQPTWSKELQDAVRRLRSAFPRWGKDKLTPLLREMGWEVSVSMVGRILRHLKQAGSLREASLADPCIIRRRQPRPYAVRKPKSYLPAAPSDLVQVDSSDVRPAHGVHYKHFSARDVICKWDVLDVFDRATATAAARFLDTLIARSPYAIRAIQVDGGSEFKADFERLCQERGISLYVLPPRSPKLNGCVERAQRTHKEEFYELVDLPATIGRIAPAPASPGADLQHRPTPPGARSDHAVGVAPTPPETENGRQPDSRRPLSFTQCLSYHRKEVAVATCTGRLHTFSSPPT